jgi:endonuclease/exonuclease/phosphatase family metal-dependent hydrolase
MRKVLRGYAKGQDGNLILIGTIPVPHSKDKRSPRERLDKRHLIRQGATVFKKELVR